MELGSEYNLSLSDLQIKENNIFKYLSKFSFKFYFDSGRSALKHITKFLKPCDEILLPEFICESVTNCFNDLNVKYYNLLPDFSVDCEDVSRKISKQTKIFFLLHYFGHLQPPRVLERIQYLAKNNNFIIIEDTTHSIFTKTQTIGDYIICSIRKWLPISKGGVLYYNENKLSLPEPEYRKSEDNERIYGMILKDMFLKHDMDFNSIYRKIFAECEEQLDRQNDSFMLSDFSRFIASCMDIEMLKQVRKQNYLLLQDKLLKLEYNPAIMVLPDETPFIYLFRVKNRNLLRSYLMDNKIYCAVHWPFDGDQPNVRNFAQRNASELISLPIDQRYDETHISYMADVLARYGR